jgi:PKHD-type hydroxylase
MSIQYTEYHATDEGRYDWHMDMGHGETSCRKLSTSILLSNSSDFEGGEFQFFKGGKAGEEIMKYPLDNPGDMVIFPSYMIHRVTPVTKGIRRSLVLWIGGEPFK